MTIFKWNHWCAKAFPTSNDYNGLVNLFPKLKGVYIIRNGIDVVQSRIHYPSFSSDPFSKHCETWKSHVDKYRYLSKANSAMEVRHEQLIANPNDVFQRIFHFLGVNYQTYPIKFVQSTLISQPDNQNRQGVDVKNLIGIRNPAYKNWSREQRETFKRICGETMSELGYEIRF